MLLHIQLTVWYVLLLSVVHPTTHLRIDWYCSCSMDIKSTGVATHMIKLRASLVRMQPSLLGLCCGRPFALAPFP